MICALFIYSINVSYESSFRDVLEARQGQVSSITLRPKASFSSMDSSPLISPRSLSVSSQPLGGGGGMDGGVGVGVGVGGFTSHARTTSEGPMNAGDYDGDEWGLGSDGEDTEWNHNNAYAYDHFANNVEGGRIGVGEGGGGGEMLGGGSGLGGSSGVVRGDGAVLAGEMGGYPGEMNAFHASQGFGITNHGNQLQYQQQQQSQQSMSRVHTSQTSSSMSSQQVKTTSYGKDMNQSQRQERVHPTNPFAPL